MSTKRSLALLLTAIMLSVFVVTAFASVELLRYSDIGKFHAFLSVSGGNALCNTLILPSSSGSTVKLTATLKKSTDGSNWSYVASWSTSGPYPSGASINQSVSVSSGYQYKLFVTGRVYSASGTLLETAYKNSSMVSY